MSVNHFFNVLCKAYGLVVGELKLLFCFRDYQNQSQKWHFCESVLIFSWPQSLDEQNVVKVRKFNPLSLMGPAKYEAIQLAMLPHS